MGVIVPCFTVIARRQDFAAPRRRDPGAETRPFPCANLNPSMKERKGSDTPRTAVIAEGVTVGSSGAGVMGQTRAKGVSDSGVIERERLWAGEKNDAACETARH